MPGFGITFIKTYLFIPNSACLFLRTLIFNKTPTKEKRLTGFVGWICFVRDNNKREETYWFCWLNLFCQGQQQKRRDLLVLLAESVLSGTPTKEKRLTGFVGWICFVRDNNEREETYWFCWLNLFCQGHQQKRRDLLVLLAESVLSGTPTKEKRLTGFVGWICFVRDNNEREETYWFCWLNLFCQGHQRKRRDLLVLLAGSVLSGCG